MPGYRVTVFYTEPTYAAQRGIPLREYKGSFFLQMPDRGSAIARARHLFLDAERRSGVGWVREIVRVECEQVGR
ncbi:MAG TPA: hypothetical protein RMG45_15850 [Polyangiaceae bacterium LLY-WYZ-15_(1-7)]|nr:hypothetical protein [Polyangiaceae bacterium LLY-WYZ-15_(1-7)]HJL31521.1 hypothetical protein [Polyangiaceae bacterium LLY-WYZ-15_(1-7)]HJL47325.1 hypothetical protein [Polyangiaceae bacterium LLY-WYZ-15_(1-7)]